jgi:hypothetical protein
LYLIFQIQLNLQMQKNIWLDCKISPNIIYKTHQAL